MSLSPQAIRASYAACRRVGREARSNFRIAFLLLPRQKRAATEALYAFMRHSDDLVDDARPPQAAEEALAQWRSDLERALSEKPPSQSPEPGRALLPALVDTVRTFQIPAEYLRAVLDGMEMDLRQRRYRTFDELQLYCQRVASAVGLACIHIWGFSGRDALGLARDAGIALQLTNILRDLVEDAAADRVYLPLDDLRQCGYAADDFERRVVSPSFYRLMELEIVRAERFYRSGTKLLDRLSPEGRRIFGVMIDTYHNLLMQIKRRPADVLARRMRVSLPKRLGIAARWMFVR
ncbi:MAG: phytoene/squalene synthase family protein [Thermoguttaceae bacterium]|jgi:phytoene synthase